MSFGIWQIALIVLVVVLVFGAGKIPRVMGDFAKGIKSFKSGMKDGEMGEPTPASPTDKPAESGEHHVRYWLDRDYDRHGYRHFGGRPEGAA
jgi:TatA/E family protein of Tat protein translocase